MDNLDNSNCNAENANSNAGSFFENDGCKNVGGDFSKKRILIAEHSKILAKLIQSVFEGKEYETFLCEDGFDALKIALAQKPDCILADRMLPSIDGIQLCSILKNGYDFSDMNFVLFSAEDDSGDFWIKNCQADKIVFLSKDNVQELVDAVRQFHASDKIKKSSFIKEKSQGFEEKELTFFAVEAMEQSRFYTNILKRIVKFTEYMDDLNELVRQIFTFLYELSSYDAAVIILKDKPHKLFTVFLGKQDNGTKTRFIEICRNDYEEQLQNLNSNDYENFSENLESVVKNEGKNYSSYVMFPVCDFEKNETIATIHLASVKNKGFTSKIQSSIQMITNSLGPIISEAVSKKNLVQSEQKLRSVLSQFVPKEIIEDLLVKEKEESQESNNEKRKVAVLICDIRNFTSISEINQPENVVGFLNGYFSSMVEIIKKHGGSIDKFMGDAIMALFGAPISYVDNAKRAVEAALEMIDALDTVNTSVLTLPEGCSFDIGIGIHYGEAIVGNIGCKEKSDYTVIGDSVNLASRIEGLTKQYGAKIMVSQAVADELGNQFNAMQLDKVRVKGKKQGVQVYKVCGKALPEDYSDNYEKGLKLYFTGAWTLALSYFEKAASVLPEDKAAKLMLNRCKEFMENPPEDWNGAVALNSK